MNFGQVDAEKYARKLYKDIAKLVKPLDINFKIL
jgi:hypothetical protein